MPALLSLSTDSPANMGGLNPPALSSKTSPEEMASFFNSILTFVDEQTKEMKSVHARSLKTARKMLIASFIWKYFQGFNAGIPVNTLKFSDTSKFPVLTLEKLGSVNKFLIKCGLSKDERLTILEDFKHWAPGKGNGLIGNFLKNWSSGMSQGMGWYVGETDTFPTDQKGNKISIPWVGHFLSLVCLFPTEKRFTETGALLQHPTPA